MTENNANCEINIEIPDHSEELLKAEEQIGKLRTDLKITAVQKSITDTYHNQMYESIMYVLDYIGQLSTSVFDIGDQLRDSYYKTYVLSPELAKTLWLRRCEELHHPYNILKNRCFKSLDELDAMYFKKYNKHPPNWKI